MTRLLTDYEIEFILDFIIPNTNIPYDTAMSIVNINKNRLRSQLKVQKIYPEIIPQLKEKIEKNYYESIISPGESVGIICGQSLGEKNTQSSVSYMEEILIKQNNIVKKVKIGEFIDDTMGIDTNISKSIDGVQIMTLNQQEKVEWKYISEISRHLPHGDLVKVKTLSRREVITTLSHSHLKRVKNGIIPILGSQLKVGDRIPVIIKAPTNDYEKMKKTLKEYIDKYGVQKETEISIKLKDKSIIENVRMGLTYFGILGIIYSYKNPENYILKIQGEYFNMYNKKIRDLPNFQLIQNNTLLFEIDKIPEVENHISDICKKVGLKYQKLNGDISRPQFKKNIDHLMKNLGADFSIYLSIVDSDIIWDKITHLEIIKESTYKHKYVYDFSVEGNETFALFSGIIVHNTLNSFHKCGQTEKVTVEGVPRFQEILNATKSSKVVSSKIYFNEKVDTIQELRKMIGHQFVELTLNKLSISMKIVMNKEDELWYDIFHILYSDESWYKDFRSYKNCISIKLNNDILYKYKLTMIDIAKFIGSEYDDLYCVFSPDNICQFDIFADTSVINLPVDRILYIDTENAVEIYLEECVSPILEKLIITGISGIENIYYTQDKDEWFIETEGSNLKKFMANSMVDITRSISNNMWEIYEIFGIEATKNFLIDECINIMEGVNLCHIKLLVDRMTFLGTISSISRYTMRKDDSGVFSKACFEESTDIFLKAGSSSEIDPMVGISACIIAGKQGNIGTGMMDIKIDVDNLPEIKQEKIEELEEFVEA